MPGIRDAGKYRFIFQVGILYSANRHPSPKRPMYIYIRPPLFPFSSFQLCILRVSSSAAIPRRRDKPLSPPSLPLCHSSTGVSFPYRISYENRASKRGASVPSIQRRRRDAEEDAGLLVIVVYGLLVRRARSRDENRFAAGTIARGNSRSRGERTRGNKPCRAYR